MPRDGLGESYGLGPGRLRGGRAFVIGSRAELKRRTAGSIFWSLVRAFVEQGFAFVLFLVLAHLISPKEMGLFALALLFAEFGKLLASAGFPDAIVREPDLDEELADSIFCANFLMAVAIAAVLSALAIPLSIYFREPALRSLIWAVVVVIPISALGGVHTGRKLREFGYRSVAARVFIAGLCGGVLGITAAAYGWGAWSLVLQRTVTETLSTLMAWQAFRWMPRLRLNWGRTIGVIKFSGKIMLTQASWFVVVRSQDFIIGRGLNAASVGVFRLSFRAIDMLIQFSVAPFASSALSTLAPLQHDRNGLASAILRYNSVIGLIVCPAFLGFGVLAPEAIPFLFGSRWAEAVPVAQVLSLGFLSHAINTASVPAFSAIGRPGATLKLAAMHIVVGITLTIIAVPYGLLAVAIAYVSRIYLLVPFQVSMLISLTGVRLRDLVARLWPPLVSALVMSGLLWGARPWVLTFTNGVAYLALMITAGSLVYLAALWLLAPRFTRELIQFARVLRGNREGTNAAP